MINNCSVLKKTLTEKTRFKSMNDNIELDLKVGDTADFKLKSFFLSCISPALKVMLSMLAIVFLVGLLADYWGELIAFLVVEERLFYAVFMISIVSMFSVLVTFCACMTYKSLPKSILASVLIAGIIMFLLSLVSVHLSFGIFGLTGFKFVCCMAMHLPIALILIIFASI